jgi:hypothetical protein
MKGRTYLAMALMAGVALLMSASLGAAPTVVGAEKCKMCHKVEFESWAKTKHATAKEKVECETCHGPGSDYKAMNVMKDAAKAKAAGLIAKPAKAGCTEKCHKDKFSDDMLTKTHDKKAKKA